MNNIIPDNGMDYTVALNLEQGCEKAIGFTCSCYKAKAWACLHCMFYYKPETPV